MSTSTYKMSKQLKTQLALGNFDSKEQKNYIKRTSIRAEIIAASKPKAKTEQRSQPSTANHGDAYVG